MAVTFSRTTKDTRAAPQRTNLSPDRDTPAYFANDLTKDGQTAFICHRDQIYTLRITRAGKLILTK